MKFRHPVIFGLILLILLAGCSRDKSILEGPLDISLGGNYSNILKYKNMKSFSYLNIQQTAGGQLIAISYNSNKDCYYLTKFDQQFNQLWSKEYPEIVPYDYYKSASIATCTDGGFIFVTTIAKNSQRQICCVKTDMYGEVVWQREFNVPKGGAGLVKQTSDYGYLIVGNCLGFTCGKPYYNAPYTICDSTYYNYLIKTIANGDTLWTKKHYEPYLELYDFYCRDFIETSDGFYIVSYGYEGALVLYKTDLDGNLEWNTGTLASFRFIIEHPASGLIIGTDCDWEEAIYSFQLKNLNFNGNIQWESDYVGTGDYVSALYNSKDELVIAGTQFFYNENETSFYPKTYQIQLLLYNNSGQLISSWTFDDGKKSKGKRIFMNDAGNYIVVGETGYMDRGCFYSEGTIFLEVDADCFGQTSTGIKE